MRTLQLFKEYLPETENWAFHLLRHLPDTKVVLGAFRFLRCNYYADNFECVEFPLRPMRPRHLFRADGLFDKIVWRIVRLYPWFLDRHAGPVDLIHAHFADTAWLFRRVILGRKVPLVVSFYGYDYSRLPQVEPVWRERYRRLFAWAACCICEGNSGIEKLHSLGCPLSKIRVVRLGVEAERIPVVHRQKSAGELRLVQVASFREKKGQVYAVEAFLRAWEICPNMTLTFVGPDTYGLRKDVEGRARQSPASDRIRFVDRIDCRQLHAFLGDFHVVIQPSCHASDGDCEGGAPVVLLDAQATGMPVISTRHCDIPDVVQDGATGALTPEKDVEALVKSIRRFYDMPSEEYGTFAANARRHVLDHYDVRSSGRQLHALYEKLRIPRQGVPA